MADISADEFSSSGKCVLERSLIEKFRETQQKAQPRSQSSSAISDVTSPVKLVGKIRLGRLANNGKSKMAYLPGFMGKKRPPHFVAIR